MIWIFFSLVVVLIIVCVKQQCIHNWDTEKISSNTFSRGGLDKGRIEMYRKTCTKCGTMERQTLKWDIEDE
jgi:hypothetical protein